MFHDKISRILPILSKLRLKRGKQHAYIHMSNEHRIYSICSFIESTVLTGYIPESTEMLFTMRKAISNKWTQSSNLTKFKHTQYRTKKEQPKLITRLIQDIDKYNLDGLAYLIPRSMCSWIPKPKQPVSLKFLLSNSYSLTFKPLSRSCIAFSPLTVT